MVLSVLEVIADVVIGFILVIALLKAGSALERINCFNPDNRDTKVCITLSRSDVTEAAKRKFYRENNLNPSND